MPLSALDLVHARSGHQSTSALSTLGPSELRRNPALLVTMLRLTAVPIGKCSLNASFRVTGASADRAVEPTASSIAVIRPASRWAHLDTPTKTGGWKPPELAGRRPALRSAAVPAASSRGFPAPRSVASQATMMVVSRCAASKLWFELRLFTFGWGRCPQGDNLILRSLTGAPALSRKRMAPCQLFCSLMILNTMTLTPAFRLTFPLSASSMRGRASENA